jgi:predicted dehydrogenase
MPTERIPIAVVGTEFGARIHVPGLRASGRFDVMALVGRDPERTQRQARQLHVPHALTSIDDLLARADIAALTIATPPDSHATIAAAAALAGKHVLCEQPMGRSLLEAERMQAAATAAGVVAIVGFEHRFEPARAMLGRLLERGDLGAPNLVTCVTNTAAFVDPQHPPPAWLFDATAGGGWLASSGSHMLDGLRAWLGEFHAVAALADTFLTAQQVLGVEEPVHSDADDTFSVVFRMACGAQGILQQSSVARGRRFVALRIAGSEATAWIDERGRLFRQGREADPCEMGIPPELLLPPIPAPSDAGPFASRELPAFVRQAQRFADLITGVRPALDPPPASFADGVACQRVLDAVREAARSGRWTVV